MLSFTRRGATHGAAGPRGLRAWGQRANPMRESAMPNARPAVQQLPPTREYGDIAGVRVVQCSVVGVTNLLFAIYDL